ncbi:hypothetical protein FP803_03140 [Candidatus Woesearchaeota archaeon]|nr:hypothetical protein [Candidatus Woesearchaeota archaeon]MBU3942330.1 hypothetical protein [Nanoarchaeota archaeon]
MRINIDNNEMQKQKLYLKAGAILKYFLGTSNKIETIILCRNNEIDLVTTDQDLYEALGSLKDYDNFNQRKLVKFLEVVEIGSLKRVKGEERTILSHERVEELRKIALKKDD